MPATQQADVPDGQPAALHAGGRPGDELLAADGRRLQDQRLREAQEGPRDVPRGYTQPVVLDCHFGKLHSILERSLNIFFI